MYIIILNQRHMKFSELMGNFAFPINFPTQEHMKFTEHFHEYQKFHMSCTFPTQGHVTFNEHFPYVTEISKRKLMTKYSTFNNR